MAPAKVHGVEDREVREVVASKIEEPGEVV